MKVVSLPKRIMSLLLLSTSLLGIYTTKTQAASLMTELVTNGGAETGNTTGWVNLGGMTVITESEDSLAVQFGDFAFAGGNGFSTSTLFQSIDVSELSTEIDSGVIESNFSIYLQSRNTGGFIDLATARVTFVDNVDRVLDSFLFQGNPNNFPDFNYNFFADTRIVPTNTTDIEILLVATRTGGSSTEAFFDEVSLELNDTSRNPQAPEPTTILGLLAVGTYSLVTKNRKVGKSISGKG